MEDAVSSVASAVAREIRPAPKNEAQVANVRDTAPVVEPSRSPEPVSRPEALRAEAPSGESVPVARNAPPPPAVSEAQVQQLSQKLNEALNDTELQFLARPEKTNGELNFQVVDKETGRVIRSFPPGEIPSLLERIGKGNLLLDDKA